MLHLHRLENGQPVAHRNPVAGRHEDGLDEPRHRRLDHAGPRARSAGDSQRIDDPEAMGIACKNDHLRPGHDHARRNGCPVDAPSCAVAGQLMRRAAQLDPEPPAGPHLDHGRHDLAPMVQHHPPPQRRPKGKARNRPRLPVQPQRPQGRQRHDPRRGHGDGGQDLQIPRDQPGIHIPCGEPRMPRQAPQKGKIRHRPRHLGPRKRLFQLPQRHIPRRPVDDDLGNHRIVPGRDLVPRPDTGIGPRPVRKAQMRQAPRRGQKPLGHILGVKPRLESMARDRQFLLRARQPLARRHAQLPFDQIDPGDRFGHRMLDLQPRVHLHEPEPVGPQPP